MMFVSTVEGLRTSMEVLRLETPDVKKQLIWFTVFYVSVSLLLVPKTWWQGSLPSVTQTAFSYRLSQVIRIVWSQFSLKKILSTYPSEFKIIFNLTSKSFIWHLKNVLHLRTCVVSLILYKRLIIKVELHASFNWGLLVCKNQCS